MTDKPLILLTNDDGIASPGLAAAAAALDPLGELLIVAPHEQQSGAGRSMPYFHDGRLFESMVTSGDITWAGYSAHASPAQAVQHAVLELAQRPVSLAISGINFGENVGLGVTVSGTIGAALEAAAHGIPALAVSLQVDPSLHYHFDNTVNFSAAKHFTRLFAERWLRSHKLPGIDVLKIDVPVSATPETDWQVTRLERRAYYVPVPPKRERLDAEGRIGYRMEPSHATGDGSTDVDALLSGKVSVTPLTLDMTSHVDFAQLHRVLEKIDKLPYEH